MVDFRYHLVSIIAVFLALAVGLVLGTTALNGPIKADLQRHIDQLVGEKRDLQQTVTRSEQALSSAESQLGARLPALVHNQLAGERVLLVSAPGASGDLRDSLADVVSAAGATVTGRLRLGDDYVAAAVSGSSTGTRLAEAVRRSVPAAVDLPAGASATRLAAAALAQTAGLGGPAPAGATTTTTTTPPATPGTGGGSSAPRETGSVPSGGGRSSGAGPVPGASLAPSRENAPAATTANLDRVVTGLDEAGFLSVDGPRPASAQLVVLIVPAAPAKASADDAARRQGSLDLVQALSATAAAVLVAGPVGSADSGGLVAAARDDAQLLGHASSVDDAATPSGRLNVVEALAEQLRGRTGSYGLGSGAMAYVAAPSPSPT